jgi:hypothetical protein
MSGFGFGEEIRARFEPRQDAAEGWDDARPPRFWQSGPGARTGGSGDEDAQAGDPDAGRFPGARFDTMPAGMRPGERQRAGQTGRLLTAAQAARGYQNSAEFSGLGLADFYETIRRPAAGETHLNGQDDKAGNRAAASADDRISGQPPKRL